MAYPRPRGAEAAGAPLRDAQVGGGGGGLNERSDGRSMLASCKYIQTGVSPAGITLQSVITARTSSASSFKRACRVRMSECLDGVCRDEGLDLLC